MTSCAGRSRRRPADERLAAHRDRQIARDGLRGVGDPQLGEWTFDGETGIAHLIRRLSDLEREQFDVPEPYDIRGTVEEHRRITIVYREAPHLAFRL